MTPHLLASADLVDGAGDRWIVMLHRTSAGLVSVTLWCDHVRQSIGTFGSVEVALQSGVPAGLREAVAADLRGRGL